MVLAEHFRRATSARVHVSQFRAAMSRRRRSLGKRAKGGLLPYLRAALRPRLFTDERSDVVVSLTSFPARIGGVWAVIDTIFRQTMPLKAVLLVLCSEQFPDQRIPPSLERRVARGLTILWVESNQRSYDKLLPSRQMFPTERIVTVDDDKLYPRETVAELTRASDASPGSIIGHRGRRGAFVGGNFRFKGPAGPSCRDGDVVLAGNGGVLYPPNSLHPDVFDYALAKQLAPTHDDLWFWVMAVRAGTERLCLGTAKPTRLQLQEGTPTLSAVNQHSEAEQLAALMNHFALRRLIRHLDGPSDASFSG